MTAKKVQEPMAVLSDEMLVKPYLYRFKSVTPNMDGIQVNRQMTGGVHAHRLAWCNQPC